MKVCTSDYQFRFVIDSATRRLLKVAVTPGRSGAQNDVPGRKCGTVCGTLLSSHFLLVIPLSVPFTPSRCFAPFQAAYSCQLLPCQHCGPLPGNSYSCVTIESDLSARYHRYRVDYQREIHHDQLPRNPPGKVASAGLADPGAEQASRLSSNRRAHPQYLCWRPGFGRSHIIFQIFRNTE